ncbi:hypothetical protein K504DRAFT_491075 [Pleomassaria siparia CBS 279.74]|uniref:Uncharacterized protein n=1 Tax=Pleomassaria siparia CBS 279.74 TaxID=1314801 RepID=A0A6G1KAP5_9PLEO|nr:hypothetical protein K504DRAFT_491075 [Pleomassaria siparia CBS 279.74]
MSGAGENNRWRRSGQANRQSQQNQERTSGTNTPNPTRDGGRQQAAAALSGNAWVAGKGKATGGGGAPQSPTAQADSHVPVREYNAGEVKEFLKKRYLDSIGGNAPSKDTSVMNNASNPAPPPDQPSVFHKVQGDSVKRSSGAWGSRGNMPHLLPSGQDFFLHLKKQLATLEQNKTS